MHGIEKTYRFEIFQGIFIKLKTTADLGISHFRCPDSARSLRRWRIRPGLQRGHRVDFTMIDQRNGTGYQRAVAFYSSNSMGSGFWIFLDRIASLRRSRRRLLDLQVRRCVVAVMDRNRMKQEHFHRSTISTYVTRSSWHLMVFHVRDRLTRVLKHCRSLPERIAPLSSRVVPYVSSGAW